MLRIIPVQVRCHQRACFISIVEKLRNANGSSWPTFAVVAGSVLRVRAWPRALRSGYPLAGAVAVLAPDIKAIGRLESKPCFDGRFGEQQAGNGPFSLIVPVRELASASYAAGGATRTMKPEADVFRRSSTGLA